MSNVVNEILEQRGFNICIKRNLKNDVAFKYFHNYFLMCRTMCDIL